MSTLTEKELGLPWKSSIGTTKGMSRYQVHSNGRQIAILWNSNQQAGARAAFIVRAANSHHLMLACLRKSLELEAAKDALNSSMGGDVYANACQRCIDIRAEYRSLRDAALLACQVPHAE